MTIHVSWKKQSSDKNNEKNWNNITESSKEDMYIQLEGMMHRNNSQVPNPIQIPKFSGHSIHFYTLLGLFLGFGLGNRKKLASYIISNMRHDAWNSRILTTGEKKRSCELCTQEGIQEPRS